MNELQTINTTTDMVLNPSAMTAMNNLAALMASGKSTMPKHLQDSPADCMAIVMQAAQWQMNPYAVAQKTHLVNGTLGYEAQLVNAVISSSKAINGRFHYKYGGNWPNGQDAWVQCGAILAGETEIQWGEPLYPALVTTKNSPLWKTAPKQQAAYLAVKYWARLYAPAVILGVYSSDELEVIPAPVEKELNPSTNAPANDQQTKSSTLNSILGGSVVEPEIDIEENPALGKVAEAYVGHLRKARNDSELTTIRESIQKMITQGHISESEREVLILEYQARRRHLDVDNVDKTTGEIVGA